MARLRRRGVCEAETGMASDLIATVMLSPGRDYFSAVGMSLQAPFVEEARHDHAQQPSAQGLDTRRQVSQRLVDEQRVTLLEIFRRAQRWLDDIEQQAFTRCGLGQGTMIMQAQIALEPDDGTHSRSIDSARSAANPGPTVCPDRALKALAAQPGPRRAKRSEAPIRPG